MIPLLTSMNVVPIPRRNFLKTAAMTAGFLAAAPYIARAQEGLDTRTFKVGLVGCGGRGLGAAKDALDADPNIVIWALADAFEERIVAGQSVLSKEFGERIQTPSERQFVGLDAYKQLLATDVDVVIFATPPAFRPEMVAAGVEANKHMYVEKPMAVDVPGIMSIRESARLAAAKELVILDGFCWRYDNGNIAAHKALQEGELGKVLSFDALYATTPPKSPLAADSRPANESDVQWALRNWTAWNWLSGGQFVEQIVHSVDGMLWSMNEAFPIAAMGSGGRAQRKDDGDVWDHYDVYFEYENDVTAHISCRQWKGCHSEIIDRTFCEDGILITPYRPRIQSAKRWRFRGEKNNMYADTHVHFYRYLRTRQWVQTLDKAALKTLIAIMGREAAHSGQRILWEQIQKDTTRLVPENLTMETALPPARIIVPGRGEIV